MSQPPFPPRPFRTSSSSAHQQPTMTEAAHPPSLPSAPYMGRDSYSRHLQGPIQLPPLNIPSLAGRDYSATPPAHNALPPIQTSAAALNQQPRSYSGPGAPLNQILSSDPYHPPRSDTVHSPYSAVTPPRSAVDGLHPLRREQTIHELQSYKRQEPPYLPQVDTSVRPPPVNTSSPSYAPRHGSVAEPYHRVGPMSQIQRSPPAHGHAPYRESSAAPAAPRPSANQGRPAPGPTMNENFQYELRVRQQPIAARACGFGERDRRVIDPPPIIELRITDPATGKPVAEELKYSLNVVHCTLWSADGTVDQTALEQPDRRTTRRLMGQLVASPSVAKDEHDVEGCFFCFPDLSCRTHGKYRLKFVLMKIVPEQMVIGGYSPIITEVLSDVFTVYTAKDFPGMRPSSALTRALKLQGCNIQVKKGNEKILARKRPTPSDDENSDDLKEKRRR